MGKLIASIVLTWVLIGGAGFAAGRFSSNSSSGSPVVCSSLAPAVADHSLDPDSVYQNIKDVYFDDLPLSQSRCVVVSSGPKLPALPAPAKQGV